MPTGPEFEFLQRCPYIGTHACTYDRGSISFDGFVIDADAQDCSYHGRRHVYTCACAGRAVASAARRHCDSESALTYSRANHGDESDAVSGVRIDDK